MTGDGIPDVVVLLRKGDQFSAAGQVTLERGDGAGHFTSIQTINFRGEPNDAALGDLNGDQGPDVAVTSAGGLGWKPRRPAGRAHCRWPARARHLLRKPALPDGPARGRGFRPRRRYRFARQRLNTLGMAVNNGQGKFGALELISTNPFAVVAGDFTATANQT